MRKFPNLWYTECMVGRGGEGRGKKGGEKRGGEGRGEGRTGRELT